MNIPLLPENQKKSFRTMENLIGYADDILTLSHIPITKQLRQQLNINNTLLPTN